MFSFIFQYDVSNSIRYACIKFMFMRMYTCILRLCLFSLYKFSLLEIYGTYHYYIMFVTVHVCMYVYAQGLSSYNRDGATQNPLELPKSTKMIPTDSGSSSELIRLFKSTYFGFYKHSYLQMRFTMGVVMIKGGFG